MNPSVAGGNHAAVYVERAGDRLVSRPVGFPPESMGLLVSGGSMASLTGAGGGASSAAARPAWTSARDGTAGGGPRFVVYVGQEGHGCMRKAIELLGIGSRQRADDRRRRRADRMRVGELDAALRADRADGRMPMAVIASAGTVEHRAPSIRSPSIADVCAPSTASGCTSTARTARRPF